MELGRYGTLVSTNHDNIAQEWRIRDQISSSDKDGRGLAPEVPTKSRGLVLVAPKVLYGQVEVVYRNLQKVEK